MRNLATWDRTLRSIMGVGLLVAAFVAPLSLAVRIGVFGASGVYLLFTALGGTCLGYRLMGMSTCPVDRER
ncbi:MAG TPA: DUF2892 domain-containing protein [Polyangia bacterium]|nr:DUF2892 domain-containing protein [Polyangia bacterium]